MNAQKQKPKAAMCLKPNHGQKVKGPDYER
jgi:hypothetical protein